MLCGIICISQQQQQRKRGWLDLPETQVRGGRARTEPGQSESRAAPSAPGESVSQAQSPAPGPTEEDPFKGGLTWSRSSSPSNPNLVGEYRAGQAV